MFVSKGPINNIAALVQIMAWRRPGDKPLSDPMMVSLLTHIYVTRPQYASLGLNELRSKCGRSWHPLWLGIRFLPFVFLPLCSLKLSKDGSTALMGDLSKRIRARGAGCWHKGLEYFLVICFFEDEHVLNLYQRNIRYRPFTYMISI